MNNKRIAIALLTAVFVGGLAFGVVAEEEAAEEFTFIGAKKCKMCHNKEAQGKQYDIWMESKHAKAFESLASEEGLAEAEKLGVGNPQEAPECLKCHVTAFPVMDQLETLKITMEEGVSCESCHGPGSAYKSKKVKEAIVAGETDPATVGLLAVTEETCLGCHTEEGNSFYKEFKFEERVKEIAHPRPAADEAK